MDKCRPFNNELALWVKFRIRHKGKEIRVRDNKIIYNSFGVIAKFESHIEAVRILKLAGYKIKSSNYIQETCELLDILA